MAVSPEFHVSHNTIRQVWKRAVEKFNDLDVKKFRASPQKINNCGRPYKWNRDELWEDVKTVPSYQHKTIRSLHKLQPVFYCCKNENGNDNNNDITAGKESDAND